MDESDDVRVVDVKATFRHSAGRLGTRFLAAIRDEARLLGWRTGNPARVLVPPKDLGLSGEWVEIGPGATLEAYAPTEWLRPPADGFGLALVRIDGADTAMLAQLRPAPTTADALPLGLRLVAHFAEARSGAITDFWFEAADPK
jgi:uncharacterized OB-fold protein